MGIELAKLWVRIRADMASAKKDMEAGKPAILGSARGIVGSANAIFASMGAAGGAAALTGVVRSGEMFNRSMRGSLAIMGDVSAAMKGQMADAAFEVASATQFSAGEAADSFFFLASAGLNAEQSIAALPQVAKFAQAGLFDMARATDLATDAQSALGLTVPDAAQNLENLTRVTDVLVKANTLANASVEQFSLAMTTKAGAAARIVGMEVEELAAVLAAFADQGVKGQEAGTAFNIVLRDMQTKAIQNKSAFAEAGVAVFDAAGELNNMADIVANLEQHLQGMTDEQKKSALATLGFSDKSMIFTQTLIGTSAKIRKYEKDLKSAGGTTQEVADKQLTPFQKAMAKAGAQATKTGQQLMEILTPAITAVIEVVGNAIAGFVEWVKEHSTLIKWMIRAAAVLIALKGAIMLVRTAVMAYKTALKAIAVAQTVVLALSGPKGWAILAGAAVASAVSIAAVEKVFDKVGEGARAAAEKVKEAEKSLVDAGDAAEGAAKKTESARQKMEREVRAMTVPWHEFRRVVMEARFTVSQGLGLTDQQKFVLGDEAERFVESMKQLKEMDVKGNFLELFEELKRLEIRGALTPDEFGKLIGAARADMGMNEAKDALNELMDEARLTMGTIDEIGLAVEEFSKIPFVTPEQIEQFRKLREDIAAIERLNELNRELVALQNRRAKLLGEKDPKDTEGLLGAGQIGFKSFGGAIQNAVLKRDEDQKRIKKLAEERNKKLDTLNTSIRALERERQAILG